MRIAYAVLSVLVALSTAMGIKLAHVEADAHDRARVDPRLLGQARELAQRPTLQLFDGAVTPSEARALVTRMTERLPLPSRGNLNGIRWETADSIPISHLGPVVESNARCQWIRAAQEDRHPRIAGRIVELAAAWPHLRGASAVPTPEMVAVCYASHRREANYARRLGLRPSG